MQLKNIKDDDYHDILRLTSNSKIMQYVGNGEPWVEKKVKKFIKYNIEENELEDKRRTQYYYKIVTDNLFAGIIGFHIQGSNKYVLTIYLMKSKQGQGYFGPALELLIKKIKKHKPHVDRLYSQVYPENEIMNKIMSKKYFYSGEFKLARVNLKEYIIFLRKNTYTLYSTYGNKDMLENILAKRGIWKEAEKGESIDFLYVEGKYAYDKNLYNIESLLKNQVKIGDIFFTTKDKLYSVLGPLKKDYLLETYNFNSTDVNKIEDKFDGEKIWIIKPSRGFQGMGIKISTNYKELTKHLKINKQYKDWSLQEYISEPSLYNNRKFHIRFYILIDTDNNYYLCKYGWVALAKKMYTLTDFHDNDIHDTHFQPGGEKIYYPDFLGNDSDNIDKINKKIREIIIDVKEKQSAVKCYPESTKCYEMLGMDVMLDSDLTIKLLEINTKIGMPFVGNKMRNYLLEGVMEHYVDKYFPPKKEVKEMNYFDKIEN